MRKSKKAVGLLTSLLLVTSFIAGCVKPDTTSKTETKKIETAKVDENTAVELTFWNYPNFQIVDNTPGKYEQQLIEAFNKKYPNIKVNVEMIAFNGGPEKINAAIASKTQPDIVYDFPGRIIDYGRKGLLAPLDSMLTTEIKNDIPANILDASSLDNKLYMYPFNTTPFLLSFNKTLLDKLGISNLLPLNNPDRLWTAEEFTKLLKAIKEKAPKDVAPLVFYCKTNQGDQATRALVSNLYGGSTMNDDKSAYTLNSPGTIKSMEWVVKGIKEGYILKGGEGMTSSDAIDMYVQGKAAATIIYSPVLKKTNLSKKTSQFEEVFVPMPSPETPKLEAFVGGLAIFDKGNEKKIEAAKKFIDFLINDPEWGKKNLLSTGGFSVRKSITNLYDDQESKYAESMIKYMGKYYNSVPGFAEMRTYWFPELQNITLGKTTVKEGLDRFVEKANTTLSK